MGLGKDVRQKPTEEKHHNHITIENLCQLDDTKRKFMTSTMIEAKKRRNEIYDGIT